MFSKLRRLLLSLDEKNFSLLCVIITFCVSRIIYHSYFGISFDAGSLAWYWQYIDPQLYKDHLLQSVYYLHSQPPLFSLFLGIILKIFPHSYPEAFCFVYTVLGLFFSIFLFEVMQEMGIGFRRSVLLTSLFMISPTVVAYENWLFYEYPTAVLLIWALLFLCRFSHRKLTADCFKFFLLISFVVYIRGILSLYWLLLVAAILLVFNLRMWKKIILACLFPVFLVLALYVKNFIIFNSFSISDTFIGLNLASSVTSALPQEIADKLIARKKISGLFRVDAFSSVFPRYTSCGIRIKKMGIPILDEPLKLAGNQNTHNLVYLDVGRVDIKDAIYVFRHYPLLILKTRLSTFINDYFLTSDNPCPFYAGNCLRQWRVWDNFFKRYFLGAIHSGQYLLLLLGLPITLMYGLFLIVCSSFSKKWHSWRVGVIAFMMFTIVFLMGSTFFILGDSSRYRFLVDAFYLILFGILIKDSMMLFHYFWDWERR